MVVNGIISSSSGDNINYSIDTNDITFAESMQGTSGIRILRDIIRRNCIYPRFRIYVLNSDETKKYQIPNDDILSGGNYQENYQNGQRRTLSFTVDNTSKKYTPSALSDFWTGTKFSFDIGISVNGEDNTIIWIRKGIFVLSNPSVTHQTNADTVSFELKDKFSILESNAGRIDTSYTIPNNTNIENIITDLLQQIDPKPILINSKLKGQTTQ